MMKKIAIVGAGGINSWVCRHLFDVASIFGKKELLFIKVFDDDVVEEKNILRTNQNFQIEDLMEPKSEVLGKRYGFLYEVGLITEDTIKELETFDDIILGVDNHKTRKLVYEFCIKHKKYLLDLRAQGTQIAYYVLNHDKGMEYYEKKFFSNPDIMDRKGSCQFTADVETDHIENGNKIIAFYGMYGIYFKHLRNEELTTDEWSMVY